MLPKAIYVKVELPNSTWFWRLACVVWNDAYLDQVEAAFRNANLEIEIREQEPKGGTS